MNFHLALWLTIPSLIMATFSLSSFAIGMTLTSLASILISLLSQRSIRISKLFLAFLITAIAWVIFPAGLAVNQPAAKQAISLAALFLCGVASGTLKKDKLFHVKSAQILLVAFITTGIFSAFSPIRPGAYKYLNYPVFPFLEPSHFAIAYTAVAAIAMAKMKSNNKLLVCISTISLALLLPNTTLLLAAIILSLLHLSKRYILAILLCAVLTVATLSSLLSGTFTYLADRLTSQNSDNLSRLVYIQGWENMYSAISSTAGLGVGFQNLGSEPGGFASDTIEAITGSRLNRSDGSFLVAKLGGEFGIVGLFLGASLLVISLRCASKFRRHTDGKEPNLRSSEAIALSITSTLILELLIRCPGYFSPSLLIIFAALPTAISVLKSDCSYTKQKPRDGLQNLRMQP